MRAKELILLVAAAAFLAGVSTSAGAAEKIGKPLDIKPTTSKPLPAEPRFDEWIARAKKGRAEALPEVTAPQHGNARAVNERGDRIDGEESGSGRLREDQGEGGNLD